MSKLSALLLALMICTQVYSAPVNQLTDAEVIASAYDMNQKAIELARLGKGRLNDMQLKSFNDRALEDHKISARTLNDAARQLQINITSGKLGEDQSLTDLEKLKGRKFDRAYLEKMQGLHDRLVEMLNDKLIPEADSAHLRLILKNMKPRLNTLQENTRQLENTLGTRERTTL